MDLDWRAQRREFLPQIRRSLSADSPLQQENMSGVTTDVEAIELTSTIHRSSDRIDSDNLQQLLQDRQAHSDQRSSDDAQAQPVRVSSDIRGQQVQPHQAALEEGPRQQNRVASEVANQHTQQDRPHENDYTDPASGSVTQEHKRTRRGGRFGDWTLEMGSMLLACGCLIAIFTILAKFNNQEQPKWPYASTLNLSTIVALIATILRLMLGNVLGAG